jgi:DnaJ-class molecular chaperone
MLFCGTKHPYYVHAGTDDEETFKVLRSGQADPDGLRVGDLYVTVKVSLLLIW